MSFVSVSDRCNWVKSKVSLKAVFDEFGIRYQDMSLPHQIQCPFHDDIHASARFYPAQNEGSGSFYCWACDMGGDVIWFVRQWFQLDSLLSTLAHIEKMFDLKVTDDDRLLQFFKAKSRFDHSSESDLVLKHVKLVEVGLAGRLKSDDPNSIRLRLFDEAFPRSAEAFRFVISIWRSFDEVCEEAAQLTYSEAVQLIDEWELSARQEIRKWQEEPDGASRLEQ